MGVRRIACAETTPLFEERIGAPNPADGITGHNQKPFLADLNHDGSLDLFVTNFTMTGEVSGALEVRYFEAARAQRVFFAEGETSLIVDVPVIDDAIDEADETLDVGLVSHLSQSNDIVAAADFDDRFDLVVTGAYGAGEVTLEIDPATTQNITGSTLAAGTISGAITAAKFTKFVNVVNTVIELTESLADLEETPRNMARPSPVPKAARGQRFVSVFRRHVGASNG